MTAPKKRKRSASSSESTAENPPKRPKVKATPAAKQPAEEAPKAVADPMVLAPTNDDVSDAESESGASTSTSATSAPSAKSIDENVRKGLERSCNSFGKALATVCTRNMLSAMRADTKAQVKAFRTKVAESLKNMDKVNKKRVSELEAKIATAASTSSSAGGGKAQDYCTTHFGSKASSALAVRKAIHATLRKDIAEYNDYLKGVQEGKCSIKTRPHNNRNDPSFLGMVRDAMLYLIRNDPKIAEAFAIDTEADVDGELDEDEIRERDAALELAQQENADYTPGDEETMYDGEENDDEGEDNNDDESDEEDVEVDPEEARAELRDLMDDSIDEEAERVARAKDEKRAAAAAGKRQEIEKAESAAAEIDNEGAESDAEYGEYTAARGNEVACPVWPLVDGRYRDCAYQVVNDYGELVLKADGTVEVIPPENRETCDKDEEDDEEDE